MILVTGGAGFIGSNFVNKISKTENVMVLDKLTYAANLDALPGHVPVVRGDIRNTHLVRKVLRNNKISKVFHFAAETHVDRSIHDPGIFVSTNVYGTQVLLQECRDYWGKSKDVYFHHVSTDEVYGSLSPDDPPSKEEDRYDPRSPYSASKAGADHLVRAYCHTFDFPANITNCTNNYGRYQSLEKLIPFVIYCAFADFTIPVYGDGNQVRDWLHVNDHCDAIWEVFLSGKVGETYNISGRNQKKNIDVVNQICAIVDKIRDIPSEKTTSSLIKYVTDRPAHDRRYDLDSSKIEKEIGWLPGVTFWQGIYDTVHWYHENASWVNKKSTSVEFKNWLEKNYGDR